MSLTYQRCGRRGAPAVVLLHPIATCARLWQPLLPALAEGFEVLSVDLPGHGDSAGVGAQDMDGFGQALLATLEAAGLDAAVLIGVSLGAMVAQAAALAAPARIRGLVLAHTSARTMPGAREAWEARSRAAAGQGMDAQVPGTLERWFTPAFRAAAPLTLGWVAAMVRATPLPGYLAAIRAIQGLDYLDALASLPVPALVLAGECDTAVPVEQTRAIAQRLPRAVFEVLPGAPHLGNVEQPLVFLERIGRFVAELPARAG